MASKIENKRLAPGKQYDLKAPSVYTGTVNTQGMAGSNLTHIPHGRWCISPGDTGYSAYNPLLLRGWL
jgi:hypothetical protein